MPLGKKWSIFTKEIVRKENDFLGIYELGNGDGSDILYIGEGRVRSRLLDHFSDGGSSTPGVSYFRVDYIGSKETVGQRERAEIAKYEKMKGRLPKYNQKRG